MTIQLEVPRGPSSLDGAPRRVSGPRLCADGGVARVVAPLAVVAALLAGASAAHAEENIAKRPGDHRDYAVEIEPHLVFSAFDGFDRGANGWGVGGRFSIPVIRNGFISSINDSVAIGVGLDYVRYDNCYWNGRSRGPFASCDNAQSFFVPVVVQWNFFLGEHWSVFAEGGLVGWRTSFGSNCYVTDRAGNQVYDGDCGHDSGVDLALFIGGRYHFTPSTALTLRLGTPYSSLGVSFM